MWKKIALALGVAALVFAAVVAMQPSSFQVERSAIIKAPVDVVYSHIQNLRAMNTWSPYAQMDPQMTIQYEGPPAGVGARSSWEGPQMGTGRLNITGVEPDRSVEMKLEMLTPIQATNRVLFSLVPKGDATEVTWSMEGRNTFFSKCIGMFVDVDEMVGGQFEQGLASLRKVAEADAVALADPGASSR